jgi:predicted amidohydrolase
MLDNYRNECLKHNATFGLRPLSVKNALVPEQFQAWLKLAAQVSARASRPFDDQLFLVLFRLLECAPGPLAQEFRRQVEDAVDSRLEAATTRLEAGTWRIDAVTAMECLLDVVAAVRAIDKLRHTRTTALSGVTAAYCALPRDWPLADKPAWLLRRRRPPTAVIRNQMVLPNWALVHHRFLPAETRDNIKVIIKNSDAALDAALSEVIHSNKELACFSAIFDDGVVTTFDNNERGKPSKKYFRVTGVGSDGQNATQTRIASAISHANKACQTKADIFVLPEFTMPGLARDELLKHISSIATTGKEHPLLIVPGSFHEESFGKQVNRAALYDWNGIAWIEHDKNKLLAIRTHVEDVQPGRTLTLLSTRIGVFGVAICLDFCEAMNDNPWDELDVDWVLVPSYAPPGQSTYNQHLERAKYLKNKFGTTTVLAQQDHREQHTGSDTPDPASSKPFAGSALIMTAKGEFSMGPDKRSGTFIFAELWGPALFVPAGSEPETTARSDS